jgi:hypothetical protein
MAFVTYEDLFAFHMPAKMIVAPASSAKHIEIKLIAPSTANVPRPSEITPS